LTFFTKKIRRCVRKFAKITRDGISGEAKRYLACTYKVSARFYGPILGV
jgi:hypothetical protein